MVCARLAAMDGGLARRHRAREGRIGGNRGCRHEAKRHRVTNMRVGKPNEMTVQSFPLLTARISEAELAKWFPVRFHSITHPQETAEPSKAALIRLDKGEYFVLYWGEWSRQPKLKIPSATDPSRFLMLSSAKFRCSEGESSGVARMRGCLPPIAAKRISARTSKSASSRSSARSRTRRT